MIFNFYLLEIM